MEPRRTRLRFRISASSRISSNRGDQRRVAFAQGGIAFENAVHRGIGHALRAADHAARELLRDHVAVRVDFEQRAEHQPILVRAQRALIGGKLHRQHGHGAVRKIDAGAAQQRLAIDRASPGRT